LVTESSALNFSSYAPVFVDCPEDQQWIRPASNGLSQAEASWVHGRKKVVLDALGLYLQRIKLKDFNVT
jgi:lysophospholipase